MRCFHERMILIYLLLVQLYYCTNTSSEYEFNMNLTVNYNPQVDCLITFFTRDESNQLISYLFKFFPFKHSFNLFLVTMGFDKFEQKKKKTTFMVIHHLKEPWFINRFM